MSYINYKDPILDAIIGVLNQSGPAVLKNRYGIGDPVIVNRSQLTKPMCFIYYADQTTTQPTSAHLDIVGNVVINLVHDMTKDFGQGLDAKSHRDLVGLMVGMEVDGDFYHLKADSILGALRAHQDVGKGLRLSLGTTDDIAYDAMPRGKGIVTAEAVLNITASVQVLNPKFVS